MLSNSEFLIRREILDKDFYQFYKIGEKRRLEKQSTRLETDF